MPLVHRFTDRPLPALTEIGGKAYSLMYMAHAGLNVPPGVTLGVEFFRPWVETLLASEPWRAFESAGDDELREACDALKACCEDLELDSERQEALERALGDFDESALFAVRSSSPEEDLEGSSFAGGYETVLGVTRSTLPAAIVRAFASCLDARIVVYKRQHGFDVSRPRIAVVVQRQIASEIAGVGFSINPISNCFDEAVLNANWGLGESVVAGTASPDLYVIDKVRRSVGQRETGGKETSIWLTPSGGTEERADPRHAELTLSDEQALAVGEQLTRIEELYEKPMDIEWAYHEGELYLLQARPITAWTPVAPDLVTEPGERQRLYLDLTISVQGLFEPISVMGTSVLRMLFRHASREVFGSDISTDILRTLPYITSGRIYLNLSNVLAVASKEKVAGAFRLLDGLAADALAQIDEETYRAESFHKGSLMLGALNRIPDRVLNIIEGRLMPERALEGCQRRAEEHLTAVRDLVGKRLSVVELANELASQTVELIMRETLPLTFISRRAMSEMKALCDDQPELESHLDRIDRSLPNNVTVEMGLALERAAGLLPAGSGALESAEALGCAIEERALPDEFLTAWRDFLERYGHRGPRELDVAAPRFHDDPQLLYEQMIQARRLEPGEESQEQAFDRCQRERREAFEALSDHVRESSGWFQAKRFASQYHVMETLGGLREAHKFYLIHTIDKIRSRLLDEARAFVRAGRLDSDEQIFDLTLDDVAAGLSDPSLDLRQRGAERRVFPDRLASAPELPALFDSRGRIFRPPPRKARAGELAGYPISPGVARGAIKVLHQPDEKPLLPGEILVARATDPGWTPLFVNAAAIILEVGGMLQHGALVAREYGKPCVAGVAKATEHLSDGTEVEVDGAAGIVRLLS